MERNRQIKVLSIIALVLAIVGMSLGFAAFSSTLTISSSASVTPNSNDFAVYLYPYVTSLSASAPAISVNGVATGGATGTNLEFMEGGISGISGLYANFTAPGQTVSYSFYAGNAGEYDAYLRGITFTALSNGSYKDCSVSTTDSTKATDSLVQAACEGIDIKINVGGVDYELGSSISNHKLSKKTFEPIKITIEYASESAYVDGPFNVEFSDIKLNYSTVDGANLISFTIDGVQFQAESGMTWSEWFESDYNTSPVYAENDYLCSNYLTSNIIGGLNDTIVEGMTYPGNDNLPCK